LTCAAVVLLNENGLSAKNSFSLKTELQANGDRKILLAGHFGLQEVETFEKAWQEQPLPASAHVSLDLGGLEFLDSAGSLALLDLADRIKAGGGSCSLTNVPAKARILSISSMKRLSEAMSVVTKKPILSVNGDGFWILFRT
jgi:anti-anti-sigma factor